MADVELSEDEVQELRSQFRAASIQDEHSDCHFWGLSIRQCTRYHGRLSEMYARRAERIARHALASTARSTRWVLALAIPALVLAIFDILS